MSAAVPVKSGRRDWFRIIRDLAAVRDSAGVSLTMAYIARKVGRSKDAVQAWAEGSEPKESDARIVLALYAKHCPEKYRAHQAEYEIRVTEVDLAGDFEPWRGPQFQDVRIVKDLYPPRVNLEFNAHFLDLTPRVDETGAAALASFDQQIDDIERFFAVN